MAVERETHTAAEPGTTTVIERDGGGRGGGSAAAWVIALVAIAVLAIGAFFVINAQRNDALQTAAVSDAAASVAGSVDQAAESVSGAAQGVADSAPEVEAPAMPATDR